MASQLDNLQTLLAQAKEQIAAHVMRMELRGAARDDAESRPASAADDPMVAAFWDKVDALGAKIDKLAEAAARPTASQPAPAAVLPAAALQPLLEKMEHLARATGDWRQAIQPLAERVESLGREQAALRQGIQKLQEQLDRGFEQIAEVLSPPPAERQESPPVSMSQWEQALVGPALAENPALAFQRQNLVTGVLEKDAGACALAGQLLVFQSSPAERMPQLLKEIGEAYYRWQPKARPGANPMEESLAAWLQKTCEVAGIKNPIELVHPGERYDAARHSATNRGVEIAEVHGWVVLRDNGRVYTKATVTVK